jgi:chromosome segregation ATPase
MKFKSLQELVYTKDESAKKEKGLQSLHEKELANLKNKHEKLIAELKENSEISLNQQKEELDKKLLREQEKLTLEKNEMIKAKENELAQLQKLYDEAHSEVERLSGQVQQSEVGLGSASSRISRLNEMVKEKQTQITSLAQELASAKTLADNLKVQALKTSVPALLTQIIWWLFIVLHFHFVTSFYQNEVTALTNSLEKEKRDAKFKLDQRLEELRKELSSEWSERLK